MKLLLDTHTLLWSYVSQGKLSIKAKAALLDDDNAIFVSAISAFEITTKHRIGKLPESEILIQDFSGYLSRAGFIEAPVTIRHAELAGTFQHDHRDPFDRLLIAQALIDDLVLLSNDRLFDDFNVKRLW